MDSDVAGGEEVPKGSSKPGKVPTLPFQCLCSLSLHDAGASTEDILVNTSLFPAQSVRAGDIMQIVAVDGFEKHNTGAIENFYIDTSRLKPTGEAGEGDRNTTPPANDLPNYDHLLVSEKSNIFVVKSMNDEMLSKQPNLQVGQRRGSFQDCR